MSVATLSCRARGETEKKLVLLMSEKAREKIKKELHAEHRIFAEALRIKREKQKAAALKIQNSLREFAVRIKEGKVSKLCKGYCESEMELILHDILGDLGLLDQMKKK